VVGAIVLGAIMFMALIVPLADQNDIVVPQAASKFLPPKWFDYNGGFLDGTESESDVLIDPDTQEPVDQDNYLTRAIKGDIAYTTVLTTGLSPYGRGGDVALAADGVGKPAGSFSPIIALKASENPTIAVTFDEEQCESVFANSPHYTIAVLADFNHDGIFSDLVDLTAVSTDYSAQTLTNFKAAIASNAAYLAAGSPASFTGRFLVYLPAVTANSDLQRVYFSSFAITAGEGETTDYSSVSFTDATLMLQSNNQWTIYGSATLGIYGSAIINGAFHYDPYEAAFGNIEATVPENTVQAFIDKGWMTYAWGSSTVSGTYDPGIFTLTAEGEIYCPIQAVKNEQIVARKGKVTGRSLIVTESLYRWDYYSGYINKCEYPHYIFGTTANGNDFFKIVFSGLFTSLALGVMTALINITVGVIWGAVSGYFGGWTDILLERLVEILGGMPWIVMMTLIILLLGSNFWTFLLALCITGWMGVAEETRSQFYRYKGREYVLASRTLGANDWRLIFRHILPNGIGTIVTSVALIIPSVIFSEATISYLLPGTLQFSGSQSFGVTLETAQGEIGQHPYMIISASIIMVLLMISFNLFGNGLRDAFNPSLKGSDE
jgi:ABC-type dipeptide/oligopeptide/nickel transport system permease subunit